MESCEAAGAAEEDDQMVMFELEAAEALAGLARSSAELESPSQKEHHPSEDQAMAVERFSGDTSTMIKSAFKTEETVGIVPIELCSTSSQSNSAIKLRQNLTEICDTQAEKEERRLRRVLANRESARQTIRRRQAMHLELTRKAACLSEENQNLKKEKEVAVEEYNSLKGRNELLKLQMADVKKAEAREMQQDPKSLEIASSASISTPIFLYNQPSLVPFLWPSILPSSNVFQLQCASDVVSSSQFPMQHRDIASLHPGQEISSGVKPGSPLFVLPVPWLLPFFSHSSELHSHSDTKKRQHESSSAHQCSPSGAVFVEDNHHLASNLNTRMETMSCVRTVESLGRKRNSREDDIRDLAPEHISRNLPKKYQEPIIGHHKKPENVYAATKARRRRKELMKLKNVNCHHVCSESTND